MATLPQVDKVVIVGAGVFGVSTALSLRTTHPEIRTLLVDLARGNRGAASSDHNKIIRSDYPDPIYMKLALEAQEHWRSNPIFQPYYHECGMLFAEEIGMGRAAYANYKKLGVDFKAEIFSTEEAHSRFPVFDDANWTDVKENFYNPQSGWGEADGAMASITEAALAAGVEFVEAKAERLILAADRSCLGVSVIFASGEKKDILAGKTVLSVGASTELFLANTAPDWDDLQVNGRMIAAGAIQCTAKYPADQEEKLQKAPVHFLGMWHTHGESIPPFKGLLKFNCEVSFTNMVHHAGLGREISVPPSTAAQRTFSQDAPDGLKEEVANVVKNTYGAHVPGIEIQDYRMCWDAASPNQDFIIDYHPKCGNLIIASAGSFHSWKFLPIIGNYVGQRIFGTLDDVLARKWAWDRTNVGAACEMYDPTRDMRTVGPFMGWPRAEGLADAAAV
ncbi:hypothetical protein OQA88_644 [Cercophora sp. LCS_1]